MSNVNTEAVPVRLKVVYDYKDYNSVPNYAPFIEAMSVANTSLRITQYDKLQKTAATSTTQVQTTDDVDLPF